jgi:TRAP-type transport system small permease protein
MIARIESLFRSVSLGAAVVASLALAAMVLLIVFEVVQRALFSRSLMMVEEYSGYMVLCVVALGVPLAFFEGSLLRVEVFYSRLKAHWRRWLQALYDLVSLAFSALISYYFIVFALGSYNRQIVAPTPMMTPIYIPQSILALGFALLTCLLLWRLIAGLVAPAAESDSPAQAPTT